MNDMDRLSLLGYVFVFAAGVMLPESVIWAGVLAWLGVACIILGLILYAIDDEDD